MTAPSDAQDEDAPLEGVVTRSTGSWYHVQVGDETVRARIRGKFRLTHQDVTNPVAVGDRVSLRINDEDGTGFILSIHDRTNKLSRRAAGHRTGEEHIMVANVDRVWIAQSVQMPSLNAAFVDRLLVAAAVNELPAGILLNKMDLLTDALRPEVMDFHLRYADLGYPVLPMSATEGQGIEPLKTALQDQVSVITGPSGTGKSSLLNAIEPGLDVDTGEVSESTSKGTHTTTHAELHSLSFGGHLVDTPGVREFGVRQVHPKDLAHFFPEMRPYVNECKFHDCTHDHEPGCAIQDAVDRGEVHRDRYDSYLRILESLQEEEEKRF